MRAMNGKWGESVRVLFPKQSRVRRVLRELRYLPMYLCALRSVGGCFDGPVRLQLVPVILYGTISCPGKSLLLWAHVCVRIFPRGVFRLLSRALQLFATIMFPAKRNKYCRTVKWYAYRFTFNSRSVLRIRALPKRLIVNFCLCRPAEKVLHSRVIVTIDRTLRVN